jgi:hypothetical protein
LQFIVVFEIGFVLCGAAPSSATFIIGLAISGMATASMFSASS